MDLEVNERSGQMHSVVVVGDSLLTGYGLPLGGLSSRSWAAWIAWALPGCLTTHAVDGATAEQVVRDQLPLLRGRYRLAFGCIGANDVSMLDEQRFAACLIELCGGLRETADVAAVATIPARLRVPALSWRQTVHRIRLINQQIRLAARANEVLLIDLEPELTGRWSMAPDGQHPTSLGQLAAASVAAGVLDSAGVRFARHLPDVGMIEVPASERRLYDVSLRDRARGSWTSLRHYRADRTASHRTLSASAGRQTP